MPLDQPLFIVVIFEFLQGDLELFNGVEGSDPEQIFLECSDEALLWLPPVVQEVFDPFDA